MNGWFHQGRSAPGRYLSAIWAISLCLVHGDEVDFSKDILPILSGNCFQCHGPDPGDRKADLRLDTEAGAAEVLSPEEPAKSLFLERISSSDPDEKMPPHDSGKKLSEAETHLLRKWISSGAKYEAHWAFQPIREKSPTAASATDLTEIDQYLTTSLEKHGLSYSKPLSKPRLIRRATFDLTGLPPTWAEVENFLNDQSPDAFGKVIDRLLDSPGYGERWGRHWLDLARYADTEGAAAIGFKRFAFSYTYRDYVIQAFNSDLPYDQFVIEQVAADQLKLEENDPALAALGFLTVGRQFRNVHDLIDDQIDVISRGLLGMTVSCARCHDHKFDPIPTKDYYALHATLSSSRAPLDLPLIGDQVIPESYETELKKREARLEDMEREHGEVFRSRLRMQTGLYLTELAQGTPEQDTSTFFLSFRTEDLRPIVLERWRKYLKKLDDNDPVFGPWHRLSKLKDADFSASCQSLVTELNEANGDPEKYKDDHKLATAAPLYNPRILEALEKRKPKTFLEVAEVYGDVLSGAHRQWISSLVEATLEAAPDGKPIPDQDPKHRIINSAIERQLRHHLYSPDSPPTVSLKEVDHVRMLNRGIRDQVGGGRSAIHQLNLTTNAPPRAMVLEENEDTYTESFVFLRGNPIQRGEKVEPAFLSALSEKTPEPFTPGNRRLDLARAIVDPENPLTRRVIVNWVWQHHFGKGLVRTSDDFGTRGDPPSHPELLDHLATQLLEDGWSLKKLHRRIMLSQAYQQGSAENPDAREIDPTNQLLWRMPVRRLEMEAMRDALLAVSGELQTSEGGKPFEEKNGKTVPRRSVYAFLNRDVISPMAATFDGADPSACTVKRQETMVPQQALFALNSDYVQNRAAALVNLPDIAQSKTNETRITRIYRRIYSRSPDPEEIKTALQFLGESGTESKELWIQLAHVLLAANEFHFID